jgi:hypothetical protein
MLKAGLVLLLALAGCSRASTPAAQLSVSREPVSAGTRLLLVPEAGARISAQYPPTLTLDDGTVVRFDTTALSSDSAYFIAPPSALLGRAPRAAHGLLKASVCGKHEAVCRLVKLEV